MPRRKGGTGKGGKRPVLSSRVGLEPVRFQDKIKERVRRPGTYRVTVAYRVEKERKTETFTVRAGREQILHKAPGVSAIGRLRDLQRKIGQKALARELGVNPRTIRKWVNRRDASRRVISQKSLEKLNRVLVQKGRKPLPIGTVAESLISNLWKWVNNEVYKKQQGSTPLLMRLEKTSSR